MLAGTRAVQMVHTLVCPQAFMCENLERPVNDQEASHCEVIVVGPVLTLAADGTYQRDETQFVKGLQRKTLPSEWSLNRPSWFCGRVRHFKSQNQDTGLTWSSSTCSSTSVTLAWGKYALLSTCASCLENLNLP